jgi:two-component system, chemotaxis family, chemotaxis protein CheY
MPPVQAGIPVASDSPFAQIGVLVVDDDTYLRKIVRSLLSGFGVSRVYEAGDGAQGLELLDQFRPDVLLIDWEMPMLTGAEMVALVRNPDTSQNATVPIIMMTGHTERHRIEQAMQLGVNEILVKPFSAKSLMQRLDLVINHARPFMQIGSYFGPLPRQPRGAAGLGLGDMAPEEAA